MRCEDNLCIYFDNNSCILDNIGVNAFSMCDACIHIRFSEADLVEKRKQLLSKYEEAEAMWGK